MTLIDIISYIAGASFSLALSSTKLSGWFNALDGKAKRLVIAAGVVAIGLLAVAASCGAQYYGVTISILPVCSESGITQFMASVIAAATATQVAYMFTPTKTGGQG